MVRELPGEDHLAVTCDLRDPESRALLADQAPDVDVLVNAAGWQRQSPFLNGSTEDDMRMFEINVVAAFDLCRRVGIAMSKRQSGHIINISSALARAVFPYTASYAATKHALAALTQGLRVELSHCGIRVTEICPGLVGGTGILDTTTDPQVLQSIKERGYEPITATDVAKAVIFAADQPSNVEIGILEIRPRGQF